MNLALGANDFAASEGIFPEVRATVKKYHAGFQERRYQFYCPRFIASGAVNLTADQFIPEDVKCAFHSAALCA